VVVPAEHRKVSDEEEQAYLGVFLTKKAAACAVDRFIKDDYRFNAKYVQEKSNCIKYKDDFATMDDEMKAAAEVGRLAAEEAPGRLRHRPAAAPGAAAKPQAKSAAKPLAKPAAAKSRAKRPRSSSRPARADEDARSAAMRPPTAVVAPPGQAAAAEPLHEEQLLLLERELPEIDLSSNRELVLVVHRVAEATWSGRRSSNDNSWPDVESDVAEAFVAQLEHGTIPLKPGSSFRTFLSRLLNCGTGRITKKFQGRVKGKKFQPRDGVDLDDVAQRLKPLVEAFIQALQGRSRTASRSASRSKSRSVSPRTTTAPALPLPPLLPAGVPQPPANVARPVAAPAPAAAAPGNEMDVTE
jgi:hypothetical protein